MERRPPEAGRTERRNRVVACLGRLALRVEERPRPVPGPGEVLLRMRVSGLCGTDLFKLETSAAVPGSVLGHEVVGEVEEAGAGVDGFSPGDRVVVPHHVPCGRCAFCRRGSATMCPAFKENLLEPGGFAERILVRARAVAQAARLVPDGVSDEAAVFMEPAACVLRGLDRSGLGPEGLAVVQGAGSMGLLHLLVLRALRPEVDVVVIDPLAERRRLAERLGARGSAGPGAEAAEVVRRLTDGLLADAVFDTVGGARPLEAALSLAREGGTVVLFAHAPSGGKSDFDLNSLFKHERRVLGTYSAGPVEQERVFEAIAASRLDASPLVTHRLPLEELARGVELLRRREALKVLLLPRAEGAA